MLKRILAKKLDQALVTSLVQGELAEILAICQPIEVFLFGSAARDEMTDASDLDFLVVLPDQTDLKAIKKRYYCRKKQHDYPVDIIFMMESDFKQKAKIGGVAMICANEGRRLMGNRV